MLNLSLRTLHFELEAIFNEAVDLFWASGLYRSCAGVASAAWPREVSVYIIRSLHVAIGGANVHVVTSRGVSDNKKGMLADEIRLGLVCSGSTE